MAVVIRLQGLPASAGTLDIRHYFSRLTIPDGGVHIIGGELGEAFIVFATDEDARLALMRSGEFLKGSRTKLTLSSRNEMQSTIEMSRKRYARSSGEASSYRRSGFSSPGTGGLGSMSSTLAENLVAAMQHGINRDAFHPSEVGNSDMNNYGSRMDPMMSGNMSTVALSSPQDIPVTPASSMSALFGMASRRMSDSLDKFNGSGAMDSFDNSVYNQRREQGAFNPDDVYLRLHGMPYSARELQVREFFHGLQVEAVHLKKDYRGLNNGEGFVRFASPWDAAEGLKRHKKYMGQRFVEVYRATELEWISGGTDLFIDDRHSDLNRDNRGRSPPHEEKYFHSRTRSRSPRRRRSRSHSPHDQDYWVQMKNMPYGISKKDVRNFFDELNVTDDQIYLVYDIHGKSTKEGFVKFKNAAEHRKALRYHKTCIANRAVYLYPIAKKAMLELMDTAKKQRSREKSTYRIEEKRYQSREGAHSSSRLYIYVRNLPFDISKSEIYKFFEGFGVADHGIQILVDSNGIGLGEALVKFKSEDEVLRAERLYGKRLGGREVVLKLVTSEEVLELGVGSVHERTKGQKESDYFGSYGRGSDHSLSLDMHELAKHFFEPSGNLGSVSSMQGQRYGQEAGLYGGYNTGSSNFGGYSGGGYGSRFDSGYQGQMGMSNGMAVVKAFNLPFKISVDEILDFFYGYRVIPESVTVRYNEKGLPAGDAVITFETVDEAMAAVRELNEKPIGKRNVKLSLL
ncbi:RNA-binding protein 12-like [Carcharodon carcharias]|uniref:RNA-binding protein 12-like n=1 Tax=Carcharodon carcharias TaxID=13397 RepID=UPI001B7F14CC|nr:RNA-binding protein 12-like [Carcharodon carcharias]XP_041045435.1 RNA-binding protein 12-like [Carcharodon carcharias]